MATPAQCLANTENAKLSTGPKTEAGKATAAKNGVSHGLFAAFERLAPTDRDRISQFGQELQAVLPKQTVGGEDIISQYAIAKWRAELCVRMQSAFLAAAIADERANPETAALVEEFGEDILLGRALRHDADGPNVFSKLTRYEIRVAKELQRAREAYYLLLHQIVMKSEKADPISQPAKPHADVQTQRTTDQTPRNAQCPCGSGQKFKRCCGEGSPAVLCAA